MSASVHASQARCKLWLVKAEQPQQEKVWSDFSIMVDFYNLSKYCLKSIKHQKLIVNYQAVLIQSCFETFSSTPWQQWAHVSLQIKQSMHWKGHALGVFEINAEAQTWEQMPVTFLCGYGSSVWFVWSITTINSEWKKNDILCLNIHFIPSWSRRCMFCH